MLKICVTLTNGEIHDFTLDQLYEESDRGITFKLNETNSWFFPYSNVLSWHTYDAVEGEDG